MTQEHPITPPPELRQLWAQQAQRMDPHDPVAWQQHVATQAARWGAAQELDACCKWIYKSMDLRAARRPEPPSLKEQAFELVDRIQKGESIWSMSELDTIRRALESLPD